MELWIRSQDKEVLMLINTIALAKDEMGAIIGYGIDGKVNYILGKYKTKKRALEVLDEIQKTITINETINGNYQEQDTTIKALFLKYQTRIYQMPEE